MNIDSHPRKVSELFPVDGDDGFFIPDYQRSYSWRNEQIRNLFDDIKKEDKGYYIGNLLVTPHERESDMLDIIDGQQRLITVSLLLLAIWDRLESLSKSNDGGELNNASITLSTEDLKKIGQITADISRRLLTNKGKFVPRITPLDSDQFFYYGFLRRLVGEHPKITKNRSFAKRYAFIQSLFCDTDDFPTVDSLNEYYQKLISIVILQISVTSLGDAFAVFSSLNSKGLPLSLVDLLKGQFIGGGDRAGIDKNRTLQEWESLVGIFSQQDDDFDANVTTQFLLNNYDAFHDTGKSSITKGRALQCYDKILHDEYDEKKNDYLLVLIDRARRFAQITQFSSKDVDGTPFDDQFSALKRLESSQAYPLLLFLFVKQGELELNDDQLHTLLHALICFYVRRNITMVPKASNIRAKMLGMTRTIKNDNLKGEAIVSAILAMLKSISSSDDVFLNALNNEGVYDKNAKTTRYILIALERNMDGPQLFDKGHPDNLDEINLKNKQPFWSIEHILPEGDLTDYWKHEISPEDPEQAAALRDQYTHMLGNLTLTPYNSDLSQRPFVNDEKPYTGQLSYRESKRDFADEGHFVGLRQSSRLNASIPDVEEGETIMNKTSWTIDDIVRRTRYLSGKVLEYFSFPE